jgi:hypothetical protein
VSCIIKLKCPKEHDDVLILPHPSHAPIVAEAIQIPSEALTRVPNLDQEAGCCPGNGLHCSA